ncbi:MAG: RNA chaperone Hfq [Selenomonadaceae bacterium]|nr:RNA chaperone Hfq [Selenomonadaceae bacterium]
MGKSISIQDGFLNQARKEGVPITFHLINGFQIKGLVKSFDNFTIIIDAMGKQQMIYKHAVSTITPAHPIGFMSSENAEGENAPAEVTEAAPEVKEEPAPAPAPEPEAKPKKKEKVVRKIVKPV